MTQPDPQSDESWPPAPTGTLSRPIEPAWASRRERVAASTALYISLFGSVAIISTEWDALGKTPPWIQGHRLDVFCAALLLGGLVFGFIGRRLPAGNVALFVEGPTPDWSLPVPTLVEHSPAGVKRFSFELDGLPPGTNPEGAALKLTLVGGDRSYEFNTNLN